MRVTLVLAVFLGGCLSNTVGDGTSEPPEQIAADPSMPIDLDQSDPPDQDAPDENTQLLIYSATPILDTDEVDFLARINAYRSSLGLPVLRASIALTRASNAHSQDMADHEVLSHNSSDGTDFATRVKKFYNYNTYLGENVAMGYPDAASVFAAWKASPGHDANMRGTNYSVIGISKVLDANGQAWWTTDFGGYHDAILSAGLSTILSNSGFESSAITTGVDYGAVRTLQRWHTYATGGGSATRRTGSQEAGSYGLRNVDAGDGKVVATQVVRAGSGIRYSVGARTRHLSGPSAQYVYLDFLRSDFTRISVVTTATTLDAAWNTTTATGDAPAGTAYVRILLYGPAATGTTSTHDWDTVKLTAQ
jgi:uncharacterized protein YkwD